MGRSNSRSPGTALHPWFETVFAEAAARKAVVEMSFEELEHFNSSTIAVLIQLINKARERGVGMTIRYDASLRWQTMSFDALKRALKVFEQASTAPVQFVAGKG